MYLTDAYKEVRSSRVGLIFLVVARASCSSAEAASRLWLRRVLGPSSDGLVLKAFCFEAHHPSARVLVIWLL